MLPVSLFQERSRLLNALSAPSVAGTLPVRPRSRSPSPVTRDGVPETVTPSQPVMAVAALQLSVPVPRSASFAAMRMLQSFASSGT